MPANGRPISYVPMDQGVLYEVGDACGFSEIEIQEIADSFRLSDILGDGKVTYGEVPRILNRLGEMPSETTFQKIMDQEDPEGGGLYDFQKFLKIMTHFERHIITEEELIEAFKLFDQDKSGTIEACEIKHVLGTLGDKMSEDEAEQMVQLADADGSGEIGYNEFVQTILGSQ